MRVRSVATLSLLVVGLSSSAALAGGGAPVPAAGPTAAGYQVSGREDLTSGVSHESLVATAIPESVNVARLSPGTPAQLKVILSNDVVAEADPNARGESTSSACHRVQAIACVNGDYFYVEAYHPEWMGEPVGGVVIDGHLLRSSSPDPIRHQVMVHKSGALDVGPMPLVANIVSADLHSSLKIDAVNRELNVDQLVLYTAAFGPSTHTAGQVFEVVAKLADPAWNGDLGVPVPLVLVGPGSPAGDTVLSPGQVVLSASGSAAAALQAFWGAFQASGRQPAQLRLDTGSTNDAAHPGGDPVQESLGAEPVLVHDCQPTNENMDPTVGPKTMLAWKPGGDILMVTIDGRQPTSRGMTYGEEAQLALSLGACEAVNLDDGGSTTMADGNLRVLNVPSGAAVRRGGRIVHTEFPTCSLFGRKNVCDVVLAHEERRVADMLTIVPSPRPGAPPAPFAPSPGTTVKPVPPPAPTLTQGKIEFLRPEVPATPVEPILLTRSVSPRTRAPGTGRVQALAVLLLVGAAAGVGHRTGRPRTGQVGV